MWRLGHSQVFACLWGLRRGGDEVGLQGGCSTLPGGNGPAGGEDGAGALVLFFNGHGLALLGRVMGQS